MNLLAVHSRIISKTNNRQILLRLKTYGTLERYFTYLCLLRILRDRRRLPQWSDQRVLLSWSCLLLGGVLGGMAASKLYRNSSSFQCLSNLFLNLLTFGAVTVFSGNSFHTFTILIGKHSFLIIYYLSVLYLGITSSNAPSSSRPVS